MSPNGDLEAMPGIPPALTCEQVDQEELDTRYLRGQLDAARAEAFEAHYFGCDRCWGLVQGGNQIRAAQSVSTPPKSRSNRVWWIAAVAAFAAVAGVSVLRELRTDGPEPVDTLRGGMADLAQPVATAEPNRLTLAWKKVPDAASYRVRLFGGDGTMLIQREVTDTSFSIARDSIASPTLQLVWQVHALDRLGGEMARFPLSTTRR